MQRPVGLIRCIVANNDVLHEGLRHSWVGRPLTGGMEQLAVVTADRYCCRREGAGSGRGTSTGRKKQGTVGALPWWRKAHNI